MWRIIGVYSKAIISSLNLANQNITVHFLDLSEEHYIAHRSG